MRLNKAIIFSATFIALFVIAPLATFADPLIVTTQEVTNINERSATANGLIANDPDFWWTTREVDEYGIYWNTTGVLNTGTDKRSNRGDADLPLKFSIEMNDLQPGTTYYVWAYADPPYFRPVYGNRLSFTTTQQPEVSTQAVTDIGSTTATGNGTLSVLGIPAPMQHGVCWDTNRNPTIDDEKTEKGVPNAIGPFTSKITGLETDQKYYVRAYVTNSELTVYGKQKDFKTQPGVPAVSTQAVTNVTPTSATANATLVDIGDPGTIQHGVCWNTTAEPIFAPERCIDRGEAEAEGPYTVEITGLEPGTTYYVRAFASNETDIYYYGGEVSFVTLIDPASAPWAMITNPPPRLTRQTEYQLKVAGSRIVQYRYSLDDGPWSESRNVDTALSFNLTAEGPHWLHVLGKDETGTWQAGQFATLVAWTLDTTPPKAELPNAPKGTIGTFPASILVQGSDVIAYRYSLDERNTWSSVYPASVPIVRPDLNEGRNTLSVVGADLAGNWQDTERATEITWETKAGVPTALLTNLPHAVTNQRFITIGVATPDGGVIVDKYYYRFEGNEGWYRRDAQDTIDISGLQEGEYTLCVNAGSEDGAWQDGADGISSTDSASCYTWRIDLTPPDPVQLLAEEAPPVYIQDGPVVDSRAVKLSWTWQSDDEQETILRYRVWLAENEITADNLDSAVELFCANQPGSQGYIESFVVPNLEVDKTHYFAVMAVDKAGNSSNLSSVGPVTVVAQAPEIIDMGFKEGGFQADNASIQTISLNGNNFINAPESNYIRFENNGTDFLFPATLAAEGKLELQIPLGMPTDLYWVRVVNANGVSAPGPAVITIVDAEKTVPAVRNITPRIAAIGASIDLTITGEHFEPSAEVSLVARDGQEYQPAYGVIVLDAQTIITTVDVTDDFPEGSYDIRVKNTETEFNQCSAVRLELYVPHHLDDASGGVETHKIVQLANGMVPAATTLKTGEGIFTGTTGNQRLKMKIFLMPGLIFEVKPSGQNEALPFDGHLLSPREAEASSLVIDTLGQEAIQLSMGADVTLGLKNGAVMFTNLEITLPSHLPAPGVYYLATDGGIEPAGVRGTWQGIDIEQGGTILSTRPDTPEAGQTTYSIGLLLDHFSNYAIGSTGSSSFSELFQTDDAYGPCFINAAR